MIKIIARITKTFCIIALVVSVVFFVASSYDCHFHAGWGWDCRYIWVAPVVFLTGLVILIASSYLRRLFISDR